MQCKEAMMQYCTMMPIIPQYCVTLYAYCYDIISTTDYSEVNIHYCTDCVS